MQRHVSICKLKRHLGFYHRESIDDRLAITKDFLGRHKEGLAFGEST